MRNKIAILMATYNGEDYIEEQLDSIFNQTNKNWNLWIHDDNSKDNTVLIIKEYMKAHPNKIVFIDDNISTGGAKENFSYLLNEIDNDFDYIMFCDQDDVWLEDKIELTLNKMIEVEAKNIDKPILIHSDLKVVDKNLKVISDSMWKLQKTPPVFSNNIYRLSTCNVVTGCTVMINRKTFKISNITNTSIMHDWVIALQVLKNGGRIDYIDKQLILYRQHDNNEVGAQKISYLTYFNKLNKIKKIIALNKEVYVMSKELGIFNNILFFSSSKFKTLFLRIAGSSR